MPCRPLGKRRLDTLHFFDGRIVSGISRESAIRVFPNISIKRKCSRAKTNRFRYLLLPQLFGVGHFGLLNRHSTLSPPRTHQHVPTPHSIVFNHFFFGLPSSLPSTLNSIAVLTAPIDNPNEHYLSDSLETTESARYTPRV